MPTVEMLWQKYLAALFSVKLEELLSDVQCLDTLL